MQVNYNPDVLNLLANLSNDEVFTPPKLANEVLDLLPKRIWSDPNIRFLDPVTKSGVFLREIAIRLNEGLKKKIPDQQKRIDHILKKQVFGFAITSLTSLIARRTLYGSKFANAKYAFSESFENDYGNIIYDKINHTWENGKCTFCGASKEVYDNGEDTETYAYNFIHLNQEKINKLKMKFDVIIGNPPYQLSDGGDKNEDARVRGGAIPLYHKFVQQAKKLNPKHLCMIIPSRWYSGGRGLDEFREDMLNDFRIKKIVDFPISSDSFPGVEIKGGVCYFHWDRTKETNLCEVKIIRGEDISVLNRPLLEKNTDIFIRFNDSISIFRKVNSENEESFSDLVSHQKPFGFRTFYKGKNDPFKDSIKIYQNKKIGYVKRIDVKNNANWIDKHKVFITMAYGAGEDFPHQIINKPIYGGPKTCCTETYLVIGPFATKKISLNVIKYMRTKFFRFFVLLRKNTQHASRNVYKFVPLQDFNQEWDDEKLYKKYKLKKEEIEFIESMIKPMQ